MPRPGSRARRALRHRSSGRPRAGTARRCASAAARPGRCPTAGAPGVRSLAPTAWMIACAARSARCGSLPVRCSRPKTAIRRSPESRSATPPCSVTASSNSRCSCCVSSRVSSGSSERALRGEARQAHREHDTRLQHAIVGGGGRRRAGGERDGDRVLGLGARQRVQRPARAGAALLHQLAIQRFRRGIRREVELAAQHGAAAAGTGAAPPCSGRRARSRPSARGARPRARGSSASSQVSASISPSRRRRRGRARQAWRRRPQGRAAACAALRRAHSSKLPERASKPSSSGSAASLRADFKRRDGRLGEQGAQLRARPPGPGRGRARPAAHRLR